MVIFEDLRKLLLYQKLNLGFECQLCKKKFYNRINHLEHTRSCQNVPDLKCPKCGKTFGHVRILQLHMQFHNVSESLAQPSPEGEAKKNERATDSVITSASDNKNSNGGIETNKANKEETEIALTSVKTLFDEPSVSTTPIGDINNDKNGTPNSFKILETCMPKKKSSHKAIEKPKQAKKRVGLTKIKMEDCLRCDACSCIYIDEKDYYKHMRNFHQRDVNNAPVKQHKTKRKCQSCCKQCRGSHCAPVKRPRATQRSSNLIFRFNMKDNIKNRWSQMVSQQLSDNPSLVSTSGPSELELINIKPDPDANITIKQEQEPDLSYLLSQVEVKIKTEPPDDY